MRWCGVRALISTVYGLVHSLHSTTTETRIRPTPYFHKSQWNYIVIGLDQVQLKREFVGVLSYPVLKSVILRTETSKNGSVGRITSIQQSQQCLTDYLQSLHYILYSISHSPASFDQMTTPPDSDSSPNHGNLAPRNDDVKIHLKVSPPKISPSSRHQSVPRLVSTSYL